MIRSMADVSSGSVRSTIRLYFRLLEVVMRRTLVVLLVLCVGSVSAPFDSIVAASGNHLAQDRQTKRAATFDDVLNIKAVQAATISPDGSQVIYTVAQWESDQDKMERRTRVWKVATNGSSPARQISFGERDSQPQWSPDGKYVSFVSPRGEIGRASCRGR